MTWMPASDICTMLCRISLAGRNDNGEKTLYRRICLLLLSICMAEAVSGCRGDSGNTDAAESRAGAEQSASVGTSSSDSAKSSTEFTPVSRTTGVQDGKALK